VLLIQLLNSLFLLGLSEVSLAVLQMFHLAPSINPYFRMAGSFENPAVLAMLLTLCIPYGILRFMQTKSKFKFFWCFATSSMLLVLLMTGSRTGFLALLCAVFVIYDLPSKVKVLVHKCPKRIPVFFLMLLPFAFFLYFVKKDSADGRLLIWRVCADLIAEKPLLGWGTDGFSAHYMPYQARYFALHPNSDYSLLADNINHPFNEFVLVTVNYGFIGLILLCVMVGWFFSKILSIKDRYMRVACAMALSLLVWSLFSYPYRIPFVWLITAMLLITAVLPNLIKTKMLSCLLGILCMCCLYISSRSAIDKIRWLHLQESALNDVETKVLQAYKDLHDELKNNGDFLYNFGAVLHHRGHYKESLEILRKCTPYFNDYKVQMIIAHDLQSLGMYEESVAHYRYANLMVPSKFLPLYYEMKLYEESNVEKACGIAMLIIKKPSKKENSSSVLKIKHEAKELIIKKGLDSV